MEKLKRPRPTMPMYDIPDLEDLTMDLPNGEPQVEEPDVAPNGLPVQMAQPKTPAQQLMDMVNSPEYQQKMQELEGATQQSLDLQKQGIADNETRLQQMIDRGQQVDLSPLTALVDSWAGTNYSQTYQKPKSADERDQAIMLLKDQIQKQKQGLSKEHIELLKNALAGGPLKGMMKDTGTQSRSDRAFNFKVEQDIDKKFSTDMKEAIDKGSNFKVLAQNLNSGDLATVKSSLSKFARLVGDEKGALSDSDVGRAMAKTLETDIEGLSLYLGSGGQIDNHVIQSMRKMTDLAKQYFKKAYEIKLGRTRNNLHAMPSYSGSPAIDKLYDNNIASLNSAFDFNVSDKKKSTAASKKVAPPKVGEVRDGYRFKGGEPGSPTSWEEVN